MKEEGRFYYDFEDISDILTLIAQIEDCLKRQEDIPSTTIQKLNRLVSYTFTSRKMDNGRMRETRETKKRASFLANQLIKHFRSLGLDKEQMPFERIRHSHIHLRLFPKEYNFSDMVHRSFSSYFFERHPVLFKIDRLRPTNKRKIINFFYEFYSDYLVATIPNKDSKQFKAMHTENRLVAMAVYATRLLGLSCGKHSTVESMYSNGKGYIEKTVR